MTLWLLVPRDPLIFRDGKPFTATPGERAQSFIFPYPSTVAGVVRTLAGSDAITDQFDAKRTSEVKQIAVHGPLLVEVDDAGHVQNWFFPAPTDALIVQQNEQPFRYSLAPLKMPAGAFTDLAHLNLIGPVERVKSKPLANPPRYWNWKQYREWLEHPVDDVVKLDGLGIQGPEREVRVHVSIAPETQTTRPGALFQTSGMEFIQLGYKSGEIPNLKEAHLLALALKSEATLQQGIGYLGGERRIVHIQKGQEKLPECPATIQEKIAAQKHCRLILATPAYFKDGYLPSWLPNVYGLKISVQAAALPRYQTISGWDYEFPRPKPTRRLVPAGSVYFLKLDGDKTAIENFLDAIWLNPISDDEQSRRDGFGLALFGTWNGELREMEVKS